jgi:hypothetical protein
MRNLERFMKIFSYWKSLVYGGRSYHSDRKLISSSLDGMSNFIVYTKYLFIPTFQIVGLCLNLIF